MNFGLTRRRRGLFEAMSEREVHLDDRFTDLTRERRKGSFGRPIDGSRSGRMTRELGADQPRTVPLLLPEKLLILRA